MHARDAIKLAIDSGQMISMACLQDLTDQEMMVRPHPDCNHIRWQVGHLICSEHQMIDGVLPGAMPPLPETFADRYTKETAKLNDPQAFDSKEELLKLFHEQRTATLELLSGLTEEELDQSAPESVRDYAPTVADVFSLQGGHWLMHAGQWAVIRRQLGRPPLF